MRVRLRRCRPALVVAAAVLAFGVQAAGQMPADQDPAISTGGTGFIAGQVVDASTNKPVGDVTVTIGGSSSTITLPTGEVIASSNPALNPNVLAGGSPAGAPRQVLTDAQGRFVFHSLAKGRYVIRTTAPGYVAGGAGQHRPNGPIQPVELTAGDSKVGGVTVRIWKTAAITGTVVDEAGEPIVSLPVTALRRTTVNGQARLATGASASTDDRGIYRLSNLVPGDYLVMAMSSYVTIPVSTADAFTQAITAPGGTANSDVYRSLSSSGIFLSSSGGYRVGDLILQANYMVPGRVNNVALPAPADDARPHTYPSVTYPSATVPSQGAVISLASGETRTGIDLQLKLMPTVRVSGTVTGPDGPAKNIGVRLYGPGAEAFTGFNPNLESATTATDGNGAFTFLGVTPGQYTLKVVSVPRPPASTSMPSSMTLIEVSGPGGQMMGMSMSSVGPGGPIPPPIPAEPTLWATLPISVEETDLTGVGVMLRPGLRVSGRLQFEGTKPAPMPDQLQRASVSLSSNSDPRSAGIPMTPVRVETDGRFSSGGFVPGRYQIGANIPVTPGGVSGWTFKSATLDGRNLSDDPLVIESEDISGVVITFTDRTSQLGGTVVDASGQSGMSAEVIVFPADATGWRQGIPNTRRVRSARVSQTGTYEFFTLPPGDYFVAAVDADSAGDPQDPQFLEKLAGIATRVTVADGDRKIQDLVAKPVR